MKISAKAQNNIQEIIRLLEDARKETQPIKEKLSDVVKYLGDDEDKEILQELTKVIMVYSDVQVFLVDLVNELAEENGVSIDRNTKE